MNKVFNDCVETNEPILITTNKGDDIHQHVIVISKERFLMMLNQINGDK